MQNKVVSCYFPKLDLSPSDVREARKHGWDLTYACGDVYYEAPNGDIYTVQDKLVYHEDFLVFMGRNIKRLQEGWTNVGSLEGGEMIDYLLDQWVDAKK